MSSNPDPSETALDQKSVPTKTLLISPAKLEA